MIKWDQECQEAFDKPKESCTNTPILAYANFGKPFKLHTDASVLGLGAILYQEQDGAEKVISYASRSLSNSESNTPISPQLDPILSLKRAIMDQFHEYLYGNTFDVYTDNLVQAAAAAAITREVVNIEAVSCSMQAIESFLLIPSDIITISKAITRSRSSDHSCMTHPATESSMLQTVSKMDDSDCPIPSIQTNRGPIESKL